MYIYIYIHTYVYIYMFLYIYTELYTDRCSIDMGLSTTPRWTCSMPENLAVSVFSSPTGNPRNSHSKFQLVGGTPLKNDGVRQLGWWNSQLTGKIEHVPNHQPARYGLVLPKSNPMKMPWNDHQEMPEDHQTISQKYLPLNFTQKITRKSHEMRNIRIKCTCFIIFPSSIPSNPSNPSLPRHILPSSIDTWRRKSTQKKTGPSWNVTQT